MAQSMQTTKTQKRKTCVAVNIFPSLDTMELVTVNAEEGVVDKAVSTGVFFEQTTRQLEDMMEFSANLQQLYLENEISLKQPTVLVLPSFFTRQIELPSSFSDEELQISLVSEAERFYIFKKNEPQLDWVTLPDQSVLYSAFPKTEIEKYVEAFQQLGIPLVSIEINYFSLFRGLAASGLIQEELENNYRWCLLMVTDNTFFSSVFDGPEVVKTVESPISVSMDDPMSTITEIQQDFERFSGLEILSKLVIINASSRIQSDPLVSRLGFSDQTVLIEQNHQSLRSINPESGQYSCSLEALGANFMYEVTEFQRINLLPQESSEHLKRQKFTSMALKGLIALNVLTLVIGVLMWGFLTLLAMSKESSIAQIEKGKQTFSIGNNKELIRRLFVKNALERNVQINDLLVALGESLPENMWYSSVILSLDDSTEEYRSWLRVSGNSLDPEPVSGFRTRLEEKVFLKNLEVSNIDLKTASNGRTYYQWLIQTKEQ
jgi:hypothetical protein